MSRIRTSFYSTTLVIGMVILLFSPAEAAQRYKWWASDRVKAELGLTEEQSEELEEVFQATQPQLKELMQELNHEEEELSLILHAMEAEEWEVTRQIDKAESARSALSKARILMLYRMHRELSREQVEAFHDAVQEMRDRRPRRNRQGQPAR